MQSSVRLNSNCGGTVTCADCRMVRQKNCLSSPVNEALLSLDSEQVAPGMDVSRMMGFGCNGACVLACICITRPMQLAIRCAIKRHV